MITDLAITLVMCMVVFELSEGADVCYRLIQGVGNTCFSNNPPFDNAQGYLPGSPKNIATKYYLYKRNGNVEQIDPRNLSNSEVLKERQTKILIHGFNGALQNLLDIVNALLDEGNYNVVGIDWRGGAQRLNYYQSVADSRLVGVQVGHLVKSLKKTHQISPADVDIIGHSLGAQIAGYAGKTLSGLGRISALDPAGPAFYNNDSRVRISTDDATFVDVIHTNGGGSMAEGLGLFDAVGHADFYVNGGRSQPGCSSNLCSHNRAVQFYFETIKKSCTFLSYPCNPNLLCQDTCVERGCSQAGYLSLQSGARGLYHITTSDRPPFCSNLSSDNHQTDKTSTQGMRFRIRPR